MPQEPSFVPEDLADLLKVNVNSPPAMLVGNSNSTGSSSWAIIMLSFRFLDNIS